MSRNASFKLLVFGRSSLAMLLVAAFVVVAPASASAATTCSYSSSGDGTVTVTGPDNDGITLERTAAGDVTVRSGYADEATLPPVATCTGGDGADPAKNVVVNGAGSGAYTDVDVVIVGASGNWPSGTSITVHDPDGTDDDDNDWLEFFGTAGNDTIDMGALGVTLSVDGVNQVWIRGLLGDDTLTGAPLSGVTIVDSDVFMYPADYTIDGGGGNDVLTGSSAEEELRGASGDDDLAGGGGDDLLIGGPGGDTFAGGGGYDVISYLSASRGVTINLATGRQTGDAAGDGLLGATSIEEMWGSNHADSFTGSAAADLFNGMGDRDRISGGAGDDGLYGGLGSDNIDGGPGSDLCDAERVRNCEY